MHPTRRAVLGVAVTVGIAGCIGGDDDGGDGGTSPETDGSNGSSATVQVSAHDDLGDILVGPDGMTLYMFDQDTQGEGASACSGDCASAWPPLTVENGSTAGTDVTAELTTFEREDGSTQVAAAGWPLYYFGNDEEPGDASGQGVNDVWWVLEPDGTPTRSASPTETATETGGSAY